MLHQLQMASGLQNGSSLLFHSATNQRKKKCSSHHKIEVGIIHSKYFDISDCLKSPGLSLLHNQTALTDGMLEWKQGCLGFIPFYNLTSKCGHLAIYPGVKDKKVAFTAIRQTK